ncbi:MAG: hypothetical protein H6599_07770 [Flavobacteriales bacterium]|nr:hypothetical protein [Flavobacteriales bacterium]
MKIDFSRKLVSRFLWSIIAAMIMLNIVHKIIISTLFDSIGGVFYVSYIVQLILSVSSFFLLSKLSQTKGEQLGFYFLGLTLLKFLVYLVGFRIYFLRDGEVSALEYAIFFVPYLVALIIEIAFLIYALNKAPIDLDKVVTYSDEEE